MRRWCARCWCPRRCVCSASGTGGHLPGCQDFCGLGCHMIRHSALLACVLLALTACTPAAQPLPQVAVPSPTPAPPISFPRDALPHDSLMEWWYYTGHLTSPEVGQYGFEFVIFQITRAGQPTGYLAHFAVSDIGAQRFSHQARFTSVPATATTFPLAVNGWTLAHNADQDVVDAAMSDYALHLVFRDQKPPALHHG